MDFGVLGPLRVVAGDEALALGGAQQRAVLSLLVIAAPESVSQDRLVDELWGECPPTSAEHAIQVYVSAIRKILRKGGGSEAEVRNSPSGYVLAVDPDRVDARRFERLVRAGQQAAGGDPAGAASSFADALALWRGEPLAEFGESTSIRREAERLQELHAIAVEGLVEARLALGQHAEAVGAISAAVAANPLRERPRELLMLALYRSGRHAEALDAYRNAREALDEIGLQPGPQLRQLEQAILRHDPALRVPVAATEEVSGPTGVEATVKLPGAPASRRKVVSALFCDVTSATARGEDLDPEALHELMKRCRSELRRVIERHGGTVDTFAGNAVMALFGIPRVREDDALRAVRAAAEIRERVQTVAEHAGVTLTARTAVDTGLVLSGEGEALTIGDAVAVATRLGHFAMPGEIVLGEETLRLVRDAVRVEPFEPVSMKGHAKPVTAFRLAAIDPLAPGFRRHLDVPLVGRARELTLLRGAWERAVKESGCHLLTLLGAAGVGKSRLVAELLTSVTEAATVLSGRCLHYGEGITFWPLLEALTDAGEVAQPVIERLGVSGAAGPEELFWEVRRLLESLALERPVILHIDDLQWAETMLLDLIDHVAELSRGAPILVLCVARPELLEGRPAWGGGKINAATVLLEPLAAAECERLLDQLGDGLTADARARVITASEGNPLFLEEMTALTRENGTVAAPPTIQALLAARLDSLALEERELLERGAIEGEVFHRRALRALTNDRSEGELERGLAGLVRKELIRPHQATLPDDIAFRFRHMLIRDAAYEGLPKAIRADLHERFADWLADDAGHLPELNEIAGWHLEETNRYQRELRRTTDPFIAHRAAKHLRTAGQRAARRGDTNAARNLLERAHTLAPEDDALRAQIAVDLAEQLIEGGDLSRVNTLLSSAERNDDTVAPAQLVRLQWAAWGGTNDDRRSAEAALPSLLERLARTGGDVALAKGHLVAVQYEWLGGRFRQANEHARLAVEHARRAGDAGLRSRAVGYFVGGLICGPESAETMAQELQLLEAEDLGPYAESFVLHARGELARLSGNFPEARRMHRQAIQRFRALGIDAMAGGCYHQLGPMEAQAGEPDRALAALQEGDQILAELGEQSFRSTIQAILAIVHASLGESDAALRATQLAERLSDPRDELTHSMTSLARARLALAAGDGGTAEAWTRRAVDHASQMDSPITQGDAALELAQVLRVRGNTHGAIVSVRVALKLFTAKGDQPRTHQARTLLKELHDAVG